MKISVWLIIKPEEEYQLTKSIEKLAEQYNAPVFKPHITIYSPIFGDVASISEISTAVFEDAKPFKVYSSSVKQSADLWKTVFIQLMIHPRLSQMNQDFNQRVNRKSEYTFSPHISLIYKQVAPVNRERIVTAFKPQQCYTVFGAALVNTEKAVNLWQIVKQYVFQ